MIEYSFARQPILDSSLKLFAYEFLYRPTSTSKDSTNSLTEEVLSSLIIDCGLDKASNNQLAFINMSYDDIMGSHIEALPADKVILELLEDIQPDEKLNTRVRDLTQKGFSFALDDFVYTPKWDTLIELSDIIKLDLTVTSLEENKSLITKLKHQNIKFLAEKVETHEQYNDYKSIGCELFQGYFFCKPEQINGTAISASTITKTKLIADINQKDISIKGLELTIQQDPNLTYLLAKYLNSAHFSFASPIESIKHAIVILGPEGLKKWTTILCLRDLSTNSTELMRTTLVRAKLAELIAIEKNFSNPSEFFLMGILSTLDALLDSSMQNALKTMPLSIDIEKALLNHEGDMGDVIDAIKQHEINTASASTDSFSELYIESCQWADQIIEGM